MDEQLLRAQIEAVERAVRRLRESGVRADPRLLVDIEAWLTNVRQQVEDPRDRPAAERGC